jgi:hypothetical protein
VTDSVDQRPIAVVRTRLPYIDRRSLSQAWFSALHLAAETRPNAIPARRAADAAYVPAAARLAVPLASAGVGERAPSRAGAPARSRPAESGDIASKRRRDTPAVAKRTAAFERARSYPPFRTSLTVGVGGARIKLLLRRDGPTLHVIALCAPANVELVQRALACADAHLRRSGESVRASVRVRAEPSA